MNITNSIGKNKKVILTVVRQLAGFIIALSAKGDSPEKYNFPVLLPLSTLSCNISSNHFAVSISTHTNVSTYELHFPPKTAPFGCP